MGEDPLKESLGIHGVQKARTIVAGDMQTKKLCFSNEGSGQRHRPLQEIQMREDYWSWQLGERAVSEF